MLRAKSDFGYREAPGSEHYIGNAEGRARSVVGKKMHLKNIWGDREKGVF